jgi:uncharacterized protein YjbI with pentapeptide repeats
VKTTRYGLVEVVEPDLDDELRQVSELGQRGPLADFAYADRSLRQLDLTDRRLARGRVVRVEIQRAEFTEVVFDSISFDRCAVLAGRWQDCTLTRVEFRDCKMIGAMVSQQKWANVVFRACVIEYSTLDAVRASGPVVFVDCRLREVTFSDCRLPRGHMRGCELDAVEFVGGDYRDFDLRGNDLSTLRGAASLGGAVITPAQRQELAEALVAEIDLNYVEDTP